MFGDQLPTLMTLMLELETNIYSELSLTFSHFKQCILKMIPKYIKYFPIFFGATKDSSM